MLRSFNLPKIKLGGPSLRDPRIIMRVIIGALLIANLVFAIIAFKPFGGSADDLRRDQEDLTKQLAAFRSHIASSQKQADKVSVANTQGGQFISKYFMSTSEVSTDVLIELNQTAKESAVKMGQATFDQQPVEGSTTLIKQTITIGFEGTYGNLVKFIHSVDKSPRFLIIESLQVAAPQQQGGQSLSVTLKIIAYVKDTPEAAGAAL